MRDTYTTSDESWVKNKVSDVEDNLGAFASLGPVLPSDKIVFWISCSTAAGTGLLAGSWRFSGREGGEEEAGGALVCRSNGGLGGTDWICWCCEFCFKVAFNF